MKKFLLLVITVMLLALVFCACGQQENVQPVPPVEENQPLPESPEGEVEEPEDIPNIEDDTDAEVDVPAVPDAPAEPDVPAVPDAPAEPDVPAVPDVPETGGDNNENTGLGGDATLGQTLLADFYSKAGSYSSAEELANALAGNSALLFGPAVAPVVPGYLSGFDSEISGFAEGAMFAPMIGSIPFVGYVFVLEDGADVEAFKENLSANANLRWNICTSADEMVIDAVDNTVFFVMCPVSLEG